MKSISHRIILFFGMAILSYFCLTSTASASDLKFFQHQHTVIPVNQTLDDVVSVSGDTDISGTVLDAVIVVNGDLRLTSTAHISGIVLVVGGKIDQAPGSKVLGDVYNISFDTVTKNSFLLGISLLIGVWFLRLIISILLIFISPIIHLVIKERLDHLTPMVKGAPKKLLSVGFITSILITAISILLSLTIIGIPIVFILLFIMALSFLLGFSVISSTVGEWLEQRIDHSAPWVSNAKGALLLTAGLNIPLFGGLLFLLLTWISLGMVILWLKNRKLQKTQFHLTATLRKGVPDMHFHIQQLIHQYGYLGVFFSLLLEMIGIPFPGETLLTLSGVEWTKGTFSFLPLIIIATLGNIAGSTIAYGIGRVWGRPVILRFGKFVGITDQKLENAEEKFRRYQIVLILFAKFIAGIRVLIAYIAGIDRMPFISFTLYNTIASLIWVVTFIVFGKYVGLAWEHYHKIFHQFMLPAAIVLILLIGLYIGIKRKRKARIKP